MSGDPNWRDWSETALAQAARRSRLVINPIIYSEISIRFSSMEELDESLPPALLDREPIPFEAAFLAGKVYLRYRRAGGARSSPLPDFLIGAHAAISGYSLLSRDTRRFRTYFPGLNVIAPDRQ
jgi:predicted nucleic acid-binding protein